MPLRPTSASQLAALAWCLAVLLLAAVPAAHAGKAAVTPAKGWRLRVLAEDLPRVDNLALADDGALYASLEIGNGGGRVLRLAGERREPVLENLSRPDGLHLHGQRLYVTEEVADGRVIELDLASGRWRTVATLNNPEGIALLPDGELVVSEDSVNGRIVRVRADGAIEVVTSGLNRPEGLALRRDGALIVAETATGRVLIWQNGDRRVLVDDLDEPDQVELAPDGALWVSEDANPGRLLRYHDGELQTIVSGLAAPQGIAFARNGEVLVAEQGRARILALTPPEAP